MNRTAPIHPDNCADFLTRDELTRIKLARLQTVVALSYAHVDLTRRRMQAIGLKPEDIRSLADLVRLPFTEKSDLRDTYQIGRASCRERV